MNFSLLWSQRNMFAFRQTSFSLTTFKKLLGFIISLLVFAGAADAQTTLNNAATINISMTQGQSFSQTFSGTGGIDNSYALNGTAPPGISLSTASAPPPNTNNHEMTLSGTPSAAGTYTFNIDVTATNFSAVINYSTTLVVTVSAGGPVANNVNTSVLQNSSGNLLQTDTSGTASSVAIARAPLHGTASVVGTAIRYTPDANYYGQDTLSYIALGAASNSSAATMLIDVTAVAPSVTSANYTATANSTTSIKPVIVGTATSLTLLRPPSGGRAVVNGTNIDYTPNAGFVGTDVIVITASGPGGTSVAATLTLAVTASAPSLTIASTAMINNGTSTRIVPTISGIANSIDITTPPLHGSAVVNGLAIDYTPLTGYLGDDSFTVTATGPGGTSSAARAAITVTPPAPVITPVASTILANSNDNRIRPSIAGVVNSIAITSAPAHGSASVSGLDVIYIPVTGFVGTDSVGITAYGPGGSSTATQLSINVTAPPPVINTANFSVIANSSGNSITPSLSGLVTTLSVSTNAKHGTVSVNGLNLTYTPELGYVGADGLSIVGSGLGGTSAPVSITIDVKPITTTALNQTIAANSKDNRLVLPSILGSTSVSLAAAPIHGSATVNGLNLSYTPSANYVGSDSLKLTINGSSGTLTSIDVNLQVTAPAPTTNRATLNVDAGRTASIDLAPYVSGSVLTGLSLSIASQPQHGTAVLNGSVLSYTANANYVGNDSLLFMARAIGGNSAATEVAITVNARPNPALSKSVTAVHNTNVAVVRHFEQVQIDQFSGRMLEIASQNQSKQKTESTTADRACSGNGAWASGLNSYGSYRGRDGSKYTTMGYSLGTDRCFGSGGTVAGLGIGYARDHNELPSSGAFMTATANTIASYVTTPVLPKIRVSFLAGVNQIGNRYNRIDENTNQIAYGEWKGNQAFSSSAVSGDLDISVIKFSPFVKVDLSNLSLAPYDETGNTPNILHYHQQSMRSQRSTAGFNSEMKIETPWGLLVPRLRMEVQRDAAKRSTLKINYVDYPDAVFLVPANDVDRRMSLIAFGADMNWSNGIVTVLNVTRTSGNQSNQNNRIQLRFSYRY